MKCIENAVLEVKQNDPFITIPESAIMEGIAETTKDTPATPDA